MNRVRSFILWGLCSLVVFAPLAIGGVRRWAYTTMLIAALLLFLIWLLGSLIAGQIEIPKDPLLLAAAAFGLFVLLQVLLGGSAYAHAGEDELLKLLALGLVFFLLSVVLRSREDQKGVVVALLFVGFLAALLGILQFFTAEGKIYWLISVEGTAFGPYGNRNHFAGLMEMTIPLALGLALSGSLRHGQRPLVVFMVVIMSSALLLSGSRAGILAFIFELICFTILIAVVRRGERWLLYGVTILVLFGGMLYLLGLGPVLERLGAFKRLGTEPSYQARLIAARDTVKIFRAHPFFGTGLGTYEDVFPAYNSQIVEGHWVHAHNDYVELLAETGAMGGLIAALFLWLLFRRALRSLSNGPRRGGSIVLGALTGMLGILVHSLADFNMHIPANALVFVVLASLTQVPES